MKAQGKAIVDFKVETHTIGRTELRRQGGKVGGEQNVVVFLQMLRAMSPGDQWREARGKAHRHEFLSKVG